MLAVLLGLIPAMVARSKGREFLLWWIYGSLLFIVALPHALLLKPEIKQLEQQQVAQGLKKCPFCAEMIKPDAIVCRYCGRDLPRPEVLKFAQASPTEVPWDDPTGDSASRQVGDAASDLKECPRCHEMVWTGVDACPGCSYGFRTGVTTPASPAEPPSFTVVLDRIPPPRRPALKGILRQLHNAMSDADIDAALVHTEVVVARGLSLLDANALMLKLHDQGFGPRKQREA